MAWTLDDIRIFVNDWKESGNQIMPRLQPLDGGTVLQIFGYESPITRIAGVIVGLTDRDALLSLTQTGLDYTLSGPYGIIDDFKVKTVTLGMQPTMIQTIRQDLDCYAPVFTFDVELQKE